ncbi:glycosyltransferase [Joostella sp. CR20]|uniref:glycosyltransferase n=1 Tax=Joostella sp. CR20 TaxID=2804312 RepID=UPI00313E1AD6
MLQTTVLFIGYVWPEPTSSAAGSRMLQLLQFFKNQGATVVFSSPAKKSDHVHNLTSEGIQQKEIELNNASFDDFIKELQPTVVVFDRYMMEEQFGWRVAEHAPNALRILDTEDLHFLRNERKNALKQDKDVTNDALLNSELAKRELASIFRCDLSLIISETEMKLLQEVFNVDEKLLCYLPFLLPKQIEIEQSQERIPKGYTEKEDFIFIGNFIHAPNWDAVLALKETVWPIIRKYLPKAKLHIYGAYATEKVYNLHNEKEGFIVHGWAENAFEVIQNARVMLAPIRFGAGLKGKLVEAMQMQTPSVTTAVGAEGINGSYPWNGFIFNNPIDFAHASVALYTQEEQWQQAVKNGNRILNMRFDASVHKLNLKTAIDSILEDLQAHRTHNFIGSMLMQQTTQASKYLSKWIEVKNRSK